jgi:putative membrane protein
LHPLTPVLRGWVWVVAVVIFGGQDAIRAGEPGRLVVILPVVALFGIGFGFASWWFTRYGFDGDDLRIDSGIFQRRSRRVRMDRLQAVDVVRPLVGRLLGVAELRLEVAGGAQSEAPLSYLSVDDAIRLRAELLARSAGIAADTPEAPERLVHEVRTDRLVGSTVLSGAFVVGVILLVGLGGVVILGSGQVIAGVLSGMIPGLLGIGAALWYQFGRNFGFTLAESPDGFRIRKGLLDTRAQTVPPGRIQGVALRQPLLWRIRGWVRLDVDVAGYAGSSDSVQTSTLLPVATYPEAIDVLRQVLPGAEPAAVALDPAPRRAAWRRPIGWQPLADGQRLVDLLLVLGD